MKGKLKIEGVGNFSFSDIDELEPTIEELKNKFGVGKKTKRGLF